MPTCTPEDHRESPGRCGLFVRAVSFPPEHAGHPNRDKATTGHSQIQREIILTVPRQRGLYLFPLLLKVSDFSLRQVRAWNTEPPLLPLSSPEVQEWWSESWDGRGLYRVEESRRQLQWFSLWKGWKRNSRVSVFHSSVFLLEKYRSTRVAQLVKSSTLGFGSDHNLRVMKLSLVWGSKLSAESA